VTTGATTSRRVSKIEETLSPTQFLVRWLTEAQRDYASFTEYASRVRQLCECHGAGQSGALAPRIGYCLGSHPHLGAERAVRELQHRPDDFDLEGRDA
jgi:hypothetical protein